MGSPDVTIVLSSSGARNVGEDLLRRVAEKCLEAHPSKGAVTVVLTDDDEVRDLNKQYRGIDAPTDVLSFTLGPELPQEMAEQLPLGDVVISYPMAQRQSEEYGHSLERELGWLVVHGVLQLLGYQHDNVQGARDMRSEEERILATLGLARPEN